MKKFSCAALCLIPFAATAFAETNLPPRLPRAESFFGLHFDFHASTDCKNVGAHTTTQMVDNIIQQVRPDFLQIDCKGHPGYSSYPTKVGNPAPVVIGDPLRTWRDVTARHGVALYMHYSGVQDNHACLTPGWAAINADGKPDRQATSLFGDYADKLMIPQLRELALDYDVDGAWVDGDCWAVVPDYSETALKKFREQTGIQEVPKKYGEPHWFEFMEFNRAAYRDYLRKVIAGVKNAKSNFQFCANWAFTDHMPEPVSAPVDFISGDFNPCDAVNSARFAARYLVKQGQPWDIMAWSFAWDAHDKSIGGLKSLAQLEREAAIVIALGGGFQAYFKQKRDGSIYNEQVPMMAELAKFCRARQELNWHSQPVPQVALILSTPGHYHSIYGPLWRGNEEINGVLRALVENRQSVEVVGEHQVDGKLSDYPLIVVAEWSYLEPKFKTDLVDYVKAGGNLLLVGPVVAKNFQSELGYTPFDAIDHHAAAYVSSSDASVPFKLNRSDSQSVQPATNSTVLGALSWSADATNISPAAIITPLGKGRIAATLFSFGRDYRDHATVGAKDFLGELTAKLFPEALVKIAGAPEVDVVVARKDGKLLVNLINASGPHRTKPVLDSIAPVGPVTLSIRVDAKPKRVALQPDGTELPFEFANGKIKLTVPQIKIHEAVVVE